MGKQPYKFTGESIKCNICSKIYDRPRELPCLHSFCTPCLAKHIKDGKEVVDRNGVKGFHCPSCSRFTTHTELSKTTTDQQVILFPESNLLADLVELNSMKKGTKKCDPCRRNKTSANVHSFCKNCRDALCQACLKTHRGLTSCKKHKVLPTSEFASAINTLKVEEEFCPKHEDQVLEKFCKTHDTVCCQECVSGDHIHCDGIDKVSDAAKLCRETSQVDKLEDALDKYNKHIDAVLKDRTALLKALETKKTKLFEEFVGVKKHIISQLEKMEKDLKKGLDDTHKTETRKIKNDVVKFREIRTAVTNANNVLEISENHGANSQLINTVGKVRRECEYYEENIGKLCNDLQDIDYDATLDKTLATTIKHLNKVGNVEVTKSPSNLAASPKIMHSLQLRKSSPKAKSVKFANVPGSTQNLDNGNIKETNEFTARVKGDEQDCWFTGALFLPDGRILLADRWNRKLKLFSQTFTHLGTLLLPSKPWDVANVSAKEVAVSLPSENRIQFVNVGVNRLTTGRSVKTDEPCFGLHIFKNRIMTVTYDGKPSNMKILAHDGEELTYLCVDEDDKKLFSKPVYITSSHDGSKIYVSDERLEGIVNLSETSELKFTYQAMDLGYAAGMVVDAEGNIYICGNKSNTVHVVSPGGDRMQVLIAGEVSYPRAIAIDPSGRRLLVTQGDMDTVKVYSLSK